jgi:hypothetical protein
MNEIVLKIILQALDFATKDIVGVKQHVQDLKSELLREDLNAALEKFGVTVDQALTSVSKDVREGIADFQALDKAIENSGKSGVEAGKLLVSGLSGLLTKAKTTEDVQAIADALRKASESGVYDAGQLTQAWVQVQQALAKHPPTLEQVREAQERAAKSAAAFAEAWNRVGKVTEETAGLQKKASEDAARAMDLQAAKAAEDGEKIGTVYRNISRYVYDNAKTIREQQQALEAESERSMQGVHDFAVAMGSAWGGLYQKLSAVSPALADEILRVADATSRGSFGWSELAAVYEQGQIALIDAQEQMQRNATAADALNKAIAEGGDIQAAMAAASNELNASLYYQTRHWDMVQASADAHDASIQNVLGHVRLLDDEKLSGLQSALKAAKRYSDDLNQSLDNTIDTLERQLLQMKGNELELARMDYEKQKREIDEQRRAAVKAGNPDGAVAKADKALALLEEENALTVAGIKADQAAKEAEAKQAKAKPKSQPTPDTTSNDFSLNQPQDNQPQKPKNTSSTPNNNSQNSGGSSVFSGAPSMVIHIAPKAGGGAIPILIPENRQKDLLDELRHIGDVS